MEAPISQHSPSIIFQYSPLNSKSREIRLLSVLHGARSDRIQCRINHVSLDDDPKFEALSYTWGNKFQDVYPVFLNNLELPISRTLWEALLHLRSEKEDRILWIDALCINQVDELEKGFQIQKMRDIYQAAARVLIWLGESWDDSDLAMELVTKIPSIDLDNIPFDITDEGTRRPWDALLALVRRSWWTRCWVLQEVAMASSEPLVGCGNVWLPWSTFILASDLMIRSTSSWVIQTLPLTYSILSNARGEKGSIQSIDMLLTVAYRFEATNPRDKVYSLLGLARDEDRAAIQPNYLKSVKEIYIEVVRYILPKNINILCFNVNSPRHGLPSWVPDWSLSEQRWPLWMPSRYRASGKFPAIIALSSDPSLLKICGVMLDKIRYFDSRSRIDSSLPQELDSPETEVLDNIEATLQQAIKENHSCKFKSLDPRLSDALWRTLVTDRSLIGRPDEVGDKSPPVTYGNMFEVFRGRMPVPENFMPNLALEERKAKYTHDFVGSMQLGDQRFFVTAGGRIGLGPHQMQKNDKVVVLFGVDMPFIFRDMGKHYRMIGPAYVHGQMNGEGVNFKSKNELRQRTKTFNVK